MISLFPEVFADFGRGLGSIFLYNEKGVCLDFSLFATCLLLAWVHYDENLTFIVTVVVISLREVCAGDPSFADGVPV